GAPPLPFFFALRALRHVLPAPHRGAHPPRRRTPAPARCGRRAHPGAVSPRPLALLEWAREEGAALGLPALAVREGGVRGPRSFDGAGAPDRHVCVRVPDLRGFL